MYEANLSNETNVECEIYCGASETPFKERFGNHNRDFKNVCFEQNCFELSKDIWTLKSRV